MLCDGGAPPTHTPTPTPCPHPSGDCCGIPAVDARTGNPNLGHPLGVGGKRCGEAKFKLYCPVTGWFPERMRRQESRLKTCEHYSVKSWRGRKIQECLCGACKAEKLTRHTAVASQPGFLDWATTAGVAEKVAKVYKDLSSPGQHAATASKSPLQGLLMTSPLNIQPGRPASTALAGARTAHPRRSKRSNQQPGSPSSTTE